MARTGQAAEFTATAIDGSSLAVPKGRPTVLFFMATWCGPDLEASALDRIERDQVAVVGVDVDPSEPAADLKAFADKIGARYSYVHDTTGALTKAFAVRAMDTTVVIDASGRIVYRDTIPTNEQTLRGALAKANTSTTGGGTSTGTGTGSNAGTGARGGVVSLLAFAFGAGMLATMNACGFAMLPALFGLSIRATTAPDSEPGTAHGTERGNAEDAVQGAAAGRLADGFVGGLAVSAGFSAVFAITGLLVALGLRQLAQAVPVAAVIVGVVLTLAGLAMAAGRAVTIPAFALGLREPRTRPTSTTSGRGRDLRPMVAFGAGYAVASLSCTLGVLLAVVAQATATGHPAQTLGVFAAYAAGATVILVSVSVATAVAHAGLAAGIRRAMPVVSRIGGALLAVSGLYLVIYWWPALYGRPASTSVAGLSDRLSGRVTATLDSHPVVVAVLAALLLIVAGLTVMARRGEQPPRDDPAGLRAGHQDLAATGVTCVAGTGVDSCDCEPFAATTTAGTVDHAVDQTVDRSAGGDRATR
jgi:cytochrome c-type biogenesis protein